MRSRSNRKLFFACLALALQSSAFGAAHSAQDQLKAAFAAAAAKNPETAYLNAVKYGVKWQNNALSSSERSQADEYVSRLRDAWERKRIVDGPSKLN